MKEEDLYKYIESMYDQEYQNFDQKFEFEKSDDGSTDLDWSILQEFWNDFEKDEPLSAGPL